MRAEECSYHAGDVADPDVMDDLASRAIEEFGGFDTWVNNAGVGMYGRLTEMSLASTRRTTWRPSPSSRRRSTRRRKWRSLAPRTTDLYMERTMFHQQKRQHQPNDERDALNGPIEDGRRRGPTGRHEMRRSAYTRAALSDAGRMLPILALGAIAAGVISTMRRAS